MAIEAKYHLNCLTAIKNRYRSVQRASRDCSDTTEENILQARVFAELVSSIEGNVDKSSYIIKLSELHILFKNRLRDLGVKKSINKTRLKTQLLGHFFGECHEQSNGKYTLSCF